jgi:hypothetical protein
MVIPQLILTAGRFAGAKTAFGLSETFGRISSVD